MCAYAASQKRLYNCKSTNLAEAIRKSQKRRHKSVLLSTGATRQVNFKDLLCLSSGKTLTFYPQNSNSSHLSHNLLLTFYCSHPRNYRYHLQLFLLLLSSTSIIFFFVISDFSMNESPQSRFHHSIHISFRSEGDWLRKIKHSVLLMC